MIIKQTVYACCYDWVLPLDAYVSLKLHLGGPKLHLSRQGPFPETDLWLHLSMCPQERKADFFLVDTSQKGCKVPAQATEGSAQT